MGKWICRMFLFELLNVSLVLFSQAKEGKRLKEFLEDYDDDRDDPKYYRWDLCIIKSMIYITFRGRQIWNGILPWTNKSSHLSTDVLKTLSEKCVCFSALPAGAALFRSVCGTERRRRSWMNVTGSGRRKSWRRSGRGC